jgi:hypothetical protein
MAIPYVYKCTETEKLFEVSFPMGEALAELDSPFADCKAKRYYGQLNFVRKGGDWPSKFIKDGGNRPLLQMSPNEIIDSRKKMGLPATTGRKLSEKEVAKRKKNIQDWADKTK